MRYPENNVSQTSERSFVAKEGLSFDEVLQSLPVKRIMVKKLLSRLTFLLRPNNEVRILDIGAAQGETIAICQELGFRCIGVEPSSVARTNAKQLSEYLGVPIEVLDGVAESIPFGSETFDVVIAASVIEHVSDVEKAFREASRVLKPGGIFWFHTASALCPKQHEIKHFPLFGWYPDTVKRRIMEWAKLNRPDLIGYTSTPAIHWFTPRKARALLHKHGFREVYDRWDLLSHDKSKMKYTVVLKLVSSSKVLKYLADIVRTGCSYAAVK